MTCTFSRSKSRQYSDTVAVSSLLYVNYPLYVNSPSIFTHYIDYT